MFTFLSNLPGWNYCTPGGNLCLGLVTIVPVRQHPLLIIIVCCSIVLLKVTVNNVWGTNTCRNSKHSITQIVVTTVTRILSGTRDRQSRYIGVYLFMVSWLYCRNGRPSLGRGGGGVKEEQATTLIRCMKKKTVATTWHRTELIWKENCKQKNNVTLEHEWMNAWGDHSAKTGAVLGLAV